MPSMRNYFTRLPLQVGRRKKMMGNRSQLKSHGSLCDAADPPQCSMTPSHTQPESYDWLPFRRVFGVDGLEERNRVLPVPQRERGRMEEEKEGQQERRREGGIEE